jgi:tRNA1Val (adenine37-N6)-methyltransferase
MGRNNGFTFKQFHIDHDRCAMKVGTDGILLGAWAPVDSARRVLDIGTGSGLIALMLAQRSTNDCHIDGVELDKDAAMQAHENVAASPWRVTIIESAIQDHLAPLRSHRLQPALFPGRPDTPRSGQGSGPSYWGLDQGIAASDRLGAARQLALVLPTAMADEILCISSSGDLYERCYLAVTTREWKEANRVLLLLGRGLNKCERGEIVIHSATGGYSDRYIQLTSPFYLKM